MRIKTMKIGTKSVLFGVHAFWWHPIMVAIAWIRLYGFPFDIRIWIAFFVHDLGYFGKPNMDGPDGETHPEFGAKVMGFFDYRFMILSIRFIYKNYPEYTNLGYKSVFEFNGYTLIKRNTHFWHNFCLYHSRFYSKKVGAFPSKLCFADKLSVCYDPKWFYILRGVLSGEIYEYIKNNDHSKRAFVECYRLFVKKYVAEIKDQNIDTHTKERKFESC